MNPTTAVSTAPKTKGTIQTLLRGEQFRDAVQKSLPKHLSADRFVRIALTALTKTPRLAQCDQESFFQCLLSLSQYGLEPDGRRAHLIPYGTTCTLIIDYKGLVELVQRSGLVSNLHADVVCENDEFEYNIGEISKHKIDFRKDRGPVYAVYCRVKFRDGTEKCEVMSRQDVEAIRARSKAGNNGPWKTDWSEMAKKTVFKRASKWLTLSPELRDAVEADDEPIEADKPKVDVSSLVDTAPIPALTESSEDPTDAVPMEFTPVSSETPVDAKPVQETASPKTPQKELEDMAISNGYDFAIFAKWARESEMVKDADSLTQFSEVSSADATRILRAKAGFIDALARAKKML